MKLWANSDFDKMCSGLSNKDRELRHKTRYSCFRRQTEEDGGNKADKEHHKLTKPLEKMEGFDGWKNFGITWDISTPDPLVIVRRKWSIHQEWSQTMERVAVPLIK
jgi:hypothetical protein